MVIALIPLVAVNSYLSFCFQLTLRVTFNTWHIMYALQPESHLPQLLGAQSDGKGRSFAGLAGHFDRAAVGVHNSFGNGQTESAASRRTRARFVGPIKTLKDVREVFGRDALAGVGDRHDGGAAFATNAEPRFA